MSELTYTIRPIQPEDREAILEIFNDYVLNSFAAYPERAMDGSFIDMLLAATRGYPTAVLCLANGEVAGFGFLRPYNPMPAFKKTAEISYFLHHNVTGMGMGRALLDLLLRGAREMGLEVILAGISSRNEPSLKFHRKHGFEECGRFRDVGFKFGEKFDVVWMQHFVNRNN